MTKVHSHGTLNRVEWHTGNPRNTTSLMMRLPDRTFVKLGSVERINNDRWCARYFPKQDEDPQGQPIGTFEKQEHGKQAVERHVTAIMEVDPAICPLCKDPILVQEVWGYDKDKQKVHAYCQCFGPGK